MQVGAFDRDPSKVGTHPVRLAHGEPGSTLMGLVERTKQLAAPNALFKISGRFGRACANPDRRTLEGARGRPAAPCRLEILWGLQRTSLMSASRDSALCPTFPLSCPSGGNAYCELQ